MKPISKYSPNRPGFTLVELLTVVVVIGILVALIIPALNTVQHIAANVKQKAQFSAIEIGLEAFRNDFGDYPESSSSSGYCGAQKLAEAMVGQDGFGFHPDSDFRADGMDATGNVPLYKSSTGTPDYNTYYDTDEKKNNNLAVRKGPYLELETANAVKLDALYPDGTPFLESDTFVLADSFKKVKHDVTKKQTGMPILYFRANTTESLISNIYNFSDNANLIDLPIPFDGSGHEWRGNAAEFSNDITNPNFTSPSRPYRSESFILVSAGADGNYGTADDVFNFDKD